MHQLEKRDSSKYVVTGGDDRGRGEPPLEADRQVDEGDQER
jgi:hypothetical protein